MLWFCGPFGPAKRRRPPRNPTATLDPPPALVWRPYGGCPGTQEGRGGHGGRRSGAGHRPAAGGWASPTRRPGAHPHGNLLPRASARPAALRRLPRGQEGWDDHAGGRRRLAAGGPKAPRPAKQKSGARGPWPRAPLFQDASRPAAAPPAGFSTTAQKATQKPGLSVYPAPLRPPPEKRW